MLENMYERFRHTPVVSIVAYIDPLQTSLKCECCVPHFTFRNRSFFYQVGEGRWDFMGGGGGGIKKYGFKKEGGQEKHITYWV